jgi:hypothetical protein
MIFGNAIFGLSANQRLAPRDPQSIISEIE